MISYFLHMISFHVNWIHFNYCRAIWFYKCNRNQKKQFHIHAQRSLFGQIDLTKGPYIAFGAFRLSVQCSIIGCFVTYFQELELKKKQTEEEEKEKELESNAAEEIEEGSDPELLKVKVRLDKLEEVVKEIVVESKKQLDSSVAKNQDNGSKLERQPNKNSSQSRSEASNSAAKNLKSEETAPGLSKGNPTESLPVTDASPHDRKGKI